MNAKRFARMLVAALTALVVFVLAACTAMTTVPVQGPSFTAPLSKKLTANEEWTCREQATAAGNRARENTIKREVVGAGVGIATGLLAGGVLNNAGHYGHYGWVNPYGPLGYHGNAVALGGVVGGVAGAGIGGAGAQDSQSVTDYSYRTCIEMAMR